MAVASRAACATLDGELSHLAIDMAGTFKPWTTVGLWRRR
jgi:hypothetical protein